MKYLIFNTENELNTRNEQIALFQGCTGDVTQYWFGVIKHPDQDLWALCVDNESLLSEQEQSQLKTEEQMTGWFGA